jgi:hypothetical protein
MDIIMNVQEDHQALLVPKALLVPTALLVPKDFLGPKDRQDPREFLVMMDIIVFQTNTGLLVLMVIQDVII